MRATEFVSWTKGEKGICSIAKGEIFNPAGHFNIDGVVDAMILNPYDLQVMPCPLLFREFIIRDIFRRISNFNSNPDFGAKTRFFWIESLHPRQRSEDLFKMI